MRTAFFLLLAALLRPGAVRAQLVVPPGSSSTPGLADDPDCGPDAQRLCPGKTGWQDVSDCLRAHLKELSPRCAANHPGWAQPAAPAQAAGGGRNRAGGGNRGCAADAQRLCSENEDRPGLRADCLRRHFSRLSPACAALHPDWKPAPPSASAKLPWRALQPKWAQACGAKGAACARSLGTEAFAWRCVDRSWDKLSASCREFALAHNPWVRRCGGDYDRVCLGVDGRGSSACMTHHVDELSEDCRAFANAYLGRGRRAAPARAKAARRRRKAVKR